MLLAACDGATPTQAVKIRACQYPTQDLLPFFIVQEQEIDKAGGIQLEPRATAGGAVAIEAMVAGTLDLCSAVGTVPLMTAAQRGLVPRSIVHVAANDFTDEHHRAVAVMASASVRDCRDLAGRQIAVNARDSVSAAAVVGRLETQGVHDYALVEIPFANMGLAVSGGNVAAAARNEPFYTQSLLRGDGKLLDWVMGGGPPFVRSQVTVIVFSADFVRQSPQHAKAYLRAHLRAVAWINANVERARALLARRLELTPDVGARFNLLRWPADARNDPALLDGMQPLLVRTGFLAAALPARRLYDETLLDQVLAERAQARR
jgi:NitT/TauT family transport system substrate-binding protein